MIFSCKVNRDWDSEYDPDGSFQPPTANIFSVGPVDVNVVQIEIQWDSPIISSYQIFRDNAPTSDHTYNLIAFGLIGEIDLSDVDLPTSWAMVTFSDSSVTIGQLYTYRIRAMVDENPGPFSALYSTQTSLPGPTVLVAETLTDHEVSLAWEYSLLGGNGRYWIPVNSKYNRNLLNEGQKNVLDEKCLSAKIERVIAIMQKTL